MGATDIHVLLIEDNPGDARLVREMLRRASGLSIETADSLSAAEARLSAPGVDLILLDLGLPESRGLETLARVRARHSDLPVLVLTGLDDEALALEAVRAGAQDYLVKGRFDEDMLPRIIRYASERQRAAGTLRESEERYRLLAENMADTVWLMDMDLRITYVSPSVLRLRGFTLEELNTIPLEKQMTPESLAATTQLLAAALAQAAPGGSEPPTSASAELEFYRKDGTSFWSDNSLVLIRETDGSPRAIMGVGRDITERRRAEHALRESEERYRKLVELSPDSIGIHCEGKVVYVNPAAMKLFHANRPEDLVGLPVIQLIHPDYRGIAMERVRQSYENSLPAALLEEAIVTLDGQTVEVEISAAPIVHAGKPSTQIIIRDITERKLAEQAVRESEARHRAVVQSASDAIISADSAGLIASWNPGAERIFGYTETEACGQPITLLMPAQFATTGPAGMARVLSNGGSANPGRIIEVEGLRRDGSEFPLELSVSNWQVAGETFFTAIVRDITDRKRSEEALRASEAALLEAQTTGKIGSWEYDLVEDRPTWSREMFRIFDRDPALGALKWKEHRLCIHPEDWDRVDQVVRRAIKGELPYRVEYRIVRRDGSVVWGETIGEMDRMAAGRVTQLSGTVQDVTDRKLAELALVRRVDEMEALYQTSLQTLAQGDLQALLKVVVESAARLTGGDRGALYLPTPEGMRLRVHNSFNLGQDHTGTELEMGEGAAGRAALERRVVVVEDYNAWDGSSPRFHDKGIGRILAVPMVIGDRLVGVLSVADLTSGTYGGDEIRLVSLLAEQAAMAIESGRLLDETNRRAAYLEALTSTAEALGAEVVPQVMYAKVLEEVTRQLRAEGASLSLMDPTGCETETVLAVGAWEASTGMRLPVGAGIVGSVTSSGIPFVSDDVRGDPRLARPELLKDMPCVACVPLPVEGRPIGCVMVGRHAPLGTEEVRMLTGLAEIAGNAIHRARVMATLEERVCQRTQELETANERLQDLDRMKSEFVSNVTHELRTPITNVMLYLDLARRSASETKRSHYFDVLKSESVRLGTLIESVLTLSRLERGTISMELEPQPLDALLADVRVGHQARADAKGITLDHEPDGVLPVAWVNRLQMHQVLSNLVGNAVAYAPRDAIVVLGTARRQVGGKEFVGAVVHNTGTLIRPDDMSHLFERFYRGDVGRGSGEPGTGLGLAISKEIVERHHGWIDVESDEKAGTTFSVWLPTEPQA